MTKLAKRDQPALIALSSEVSYGRVGLSIARPIYELMGLTALTISTIHFASRPGLGALAHQISPPEILYDFLSALEADGWFEEVSAIATGYFASHLQVTKVAHKIRELKELNPKALFLCDPVLGDRITGLYIKEQTAEAIAHDLLPLADIITPNLFELEWLSGQKAEHRCDVEMMAATLSSKHQASIIVTSANQSERKGKKWVETFGFNRDWQRWQEMQWFDHVPNGTGDAFAALYLSHLILASSKGERFERERYAFHQSTKQVARLAREGQGKVTLDPNLLIAI